MSTTRSVISQASTEPYIDNPNPYDVYLGRGRAVTQCRGNRIYRSTIKQYKDMYKEAKGHQAKSEIAKNVVKNFMKMGGTFYYKKDTVWEEAPLEEVLKKVKQALREKGLQTTRAPRPSRISSRGQISRRGTTSRSFPAAVSSSLVAKSQVGEKVLITRLDGSVVDAVSVCSSFAPTSLAPTSLAPTSQQLSEDRYPIDSGHWRRLRFQSKNKYTSSMIDRLSAVSFSTTMTAESFKPLSTMQSSGDIHTFRPMDQQSTHMTQTMAAGHKNPEMKQQQPVHLSEGLGLGFHNLMLQDQILSNQNEYAKSVSNHDITGQGQASDCPLPVLSKDPQKLEGMTNHSSAILPSNFNPQLLPQEQLNLSIPVRKGESVQVDISSFAQAGSNSLDDTNMNLHDATLDYNNAKMNLMQVQSSILQQRLGSITPLGEREKIPEDLEAISPANYEQNLSNDQLSNYLANMDALEHIDMNYSENEYLQNDLDLDDIFEEPTGTNNAHIGEEFQSMKLY